jgi:hypothetical protein
VGSLKYPTLSGSFTQRAWLAALLARRQPATEQNS